MVLPGYIPAQPFLKRSALVFTQGSCFAEEIRNALTALSMNSAYLPVGEEVNSPLANRYLFEYALTDKPYETADHERSFPRGPNTDHMRELLPKASIFILTLGVGHCAFRDGILTVQILPAHLQDVTWRLLSPDEHADHIRKTIQMARSVNPTIPVVLTVSPIPLKNAFTHASVTAADCTSKASLRIAAEIVLGENIPGVHYWPSFEAIRWLGGHIGPMFGSEDSDLRHVPPHYIKTITDAFVDAYFLP